MLHPFKLNLDKRVNYFFTTNKRLRNILLYANYLSYYIDSIFFTDYSIKSIKYLYSVFPTLKLRKIFQWFKNLQRTRFINSSIFAFLKLSETALFNENYSVSLIGYHDSEWSYPKHFYFSNIFIKKIISNYIFFSYFSQLHLNFNFWTDYMQYTHFRQIYFLLED